MKSMWIAQPGKEKAQGKFMTPFKYRKRARKPERNFPQRRIMRGQEVVALN